MPSPEEISPADMLAAAMNGTLESADAPTVDEQAAAQTEKDVQASNTDKDYPEGTPISSKSGGYTIPFTELETSRDKAKTERAAREAAEAENASLKAQLAELSTRQQANLAQAQDDAQARAEAGKQQTQADANLAIAEEAIALGVDVDVFGDFSEAAIAKGNASLVSQMGGKVMAEVDRRFDLLKQEMAGEIAPLREQRKQSEDASHYQSILDKHPDGIELVQSAEFDAWKKAQPAYAQPGIEAALTDGAPEAVIQVFDAFKAATGRNKADAAQRAPEVSRRAPLSLSEVPGGQHTDTSQQLLNAAGNGNTASLLKQVMAMNPEQIDAVMNRI